MKLFVLIFSFLLPFLSDGRPAEAVSTVDFPRNRDICITASQGYTFAGNNSSNSLSIRPVQSGRRINPQIRSTVRIVKGGKVIDNSHLHPFLAQSFVHLSGIYLSERYLFSICRLRL